MRPPDDAIIAVTHRCNAHCVMCNAWKSRATDALSPEHMAKLPPGLRTVNLSGGEPFLRADLPEFVRQIRRRCPGARITISTNAYLPDRIEAMMAEITDVDPSVRLAISLDGVAAAHDRVRGDGGAFDSAMALIDRLTAGRFGGLRLGMTLGPTNLDQFLGVAELAARKGLELGVVAAHAAETHLGVDRLPAPAASPEVRAQFGRVIGRWLRSWRPKQWLRAHFAYETYRRLIGRRWRGRCHAGESFFFLQADGSVYSCSVRGHRMGNLAKQDWSEIWRGPAAAEARRFARRCPEGCWMICTARSVYRARPASVAAWVLARKPAAHLGWVPMPRPPSDRPAAGQEQSLADTSH